MFKNSTGPVLRENHFDLSKLKGVQRRAALYMMLDRMNAGYPIEYLMVTEGGFTHEALCLVRCLPSRLNAALLTVLVWPANTCLSPLACAAPASFASSP